MNDFSALLKWIKTAGIIAFTVIAFHVQFVFNESKDNVKCTCLAQALPMDYCPIRYKD